MALTEPLPPLPPPPGPPASRPRSCLRLLMQILATLAALVVLIGIGIALGLFVMRPLAASLLLRLTPAPVTAMVQGPTPTPCPESSLVIGSESFRIAALKPGAGGSLPVPPDTSGTAYWVKGTNPNYIFALSPAAENQTLLASLKEGDPVKISWVNCNTTSYGIYSMGTSLPNEAEMQNQDISGVTVFIPPGPSGAGYVIRGNLIGEYMEVIPTPAPDAAGREAEVTLLGTSTSQNGLTVMVKVSIMNYGKNAFTLSDGDVQLVPENQSPLPLKSAEPSLPQEITPGDKQNFTFAFEKPSTPTAVLRIIGLDLQIDDYQNNP